MYQVKIKMSRTGYRSATVTGLYSEKKKATVQAMKDDVLDFIRSSVIGSNPDAKNFTFEVVEFKKLKTDFYYNQNSFKDGKLITQKE